MDQYPYLQFRRDAIVACRKAALDGNRDPHVVLISNTCYSAITRPDSHTPHLCLEEDIDKVFQQHIWQAADALPTVQTLIDRLMDTTMKGTEGQPI